MRQLLGTFAIVALVAAIVCYANGWLVFHKTSQSTTVEIKTEQIKDAADRAVQQSKEFIQDSATPQPSPIARPTPVTPTQPEIEAVPSYPVSPPASPVPGTADPYTAPNQP